MPTYLCWHFDAEGPVEERVAGNAMEAAREHGAEVMPADMLEMDVGVEEKETGKLRVYTVQREVTFAVWRNTVREKEPA